MKSCFAIPEHRLRSIHWMLCAAFILSVLIAPGLWIVQGRTIPTAPVIPGFEITPMLHSGLVVLFLLCLLTTCFFLKPLWSLSFSMISGGVLILLDINRLQPEFYVFFTCLQVFLFYYNKTITTGDAITGLKIVVCAVYFWSGIHKLNAYYYDDVYLWFMKAYFTDLPEGLWGKVIRTAGYVSPWIELLTPLALLFLPYKKISIVLIVLMHAFILLTLTLHEFNYIVFPWNIFMAAAVVLLFGFDTSSKPYQTKAPAIWGIAVVVWLLPVLNIFGKLDSYLSFDLYSGKYPEGIIFLNQRMIKNLPPRVAERIKISQKGQSYINLHLWSLEDIGAPLYPEDRVFRRYKKYLQQYAEVPGDVGLMLFQKGKYVEKKSY